MNNNADYPQQPHYLAKLQAIHKRNPFRPGAYHLVVEHDDWCGIFAGKTCHCDPDLTPERL